MRKSFVHISIIRLFFFFFVVIAMRRAYGQQLSGQVLNARDSLPVSHATIWIPTYDLWANANDEGRFSMKNVPVGKITFQVRHLGFATLTRELTINNTSNDLVFFLQEDNLTLNEVTVTAKQGDASLSTSYVMGRTVLDHMQMLNVTDATSLLPGGKTNRTLHLATSSSQRLSVIGNGSEMGNALFGVGVEIDGVRLSNNAIPGMDGSDTRNIATSSIESIEVITGIPSVEHGDVTNGMVRINTRKGTSPFILDLATKPNTKQLALSKGVDLGSKKGVLNISLEHTRSISDIASPYTSYARNSFSLNYANTFGNNQKQPLDLNIGLSGNLGGYNDQSDPDRFTSTYSKMKDNAVRGSISAKWLLNKAWLTNLEFSSTLNYNNRLSETQTNKSASASVAAIHAYEEGYYVGQTYDTNPTADIILIKPGYWYEKSFQDSKLLNYSARLKADWAKTWGIVNHRILVGAEYTSSGNLGKGNYYADRQYAPTWREYRYDQIPFNNNYALYAEDRIQLPVFEKSHLQIVAGVRSDITSIKNSVYGIVSNFSPRFNAEYTFWKKSKRTIQDLSLKIGWGKTVKLPSFSTLFPVVNYRDILTFAPGTTDDGSTFYAYYTIPTTPVYNPNLRWQSNIQYELGLDFKVNGTHVLLTVSKDNTSHSYSSYTTYSPFTYKFTDQSNLEKSAIPIANRIYTVNQQTGVVTVTDKTGTRPSESLSYKEITRFISNSTPINSSPVSRTRIQWMVDFKRIQALKTQFRLDGSWYSYRGIDEVVTAYMPNSTLNMADGSPYKYIGFFVGEAAWSNGTASKNLSMNLTATTHIPAIRLILSTRVEGTFYNYSQYLSEYSQGTRGFVLANRDGYTPSSETTDIYGGNRYIGVYPEYYVSLDDLNTKIPFAEKFLWAKNNDIALYNELAKMVVKTNYDYSFNPNKVSAYFSANLGITKEIGRLASITFNATNFVSNMALYKQSWTNSTVSLFNSSSIPSFYYGLSVRLKW